MSLCRSVRRVEWRRLSLSVCLYLLVCRGQACVFFFFCFCFVFVSPSPNLFLFLFFKPCFLCMDISLRLYILVSHSLTFSFDIFILQLLIFFLCIFLVVFISAYLPCTFPPRFLSIHVFIHGSIFVHGCLFSFSFYLFLSFPLSIYKFQHVSFSPYSGHSHFAFKLPGAQ